MLRIVKSLLVIVFVVATAVGATHATWLDSTVVANNSFTTGTLHISTDHTASALFNTSNIYPGWSQTMPLVVSNTGTVSLKYQGNVVKVSGDDLLYLSPKFLLKVGTTPTVNNIYTGPVSNLAFPVRTLAAGANETLYFTISLDNGADNTFQGLSAIVDFTFLASQP